MMPDHDAQNVRGWAELAELVARCGNVYSRYKLSPPSQLHSAAKYWGGLSQDEIVEVLERHFDEQRRSYVCGSGDGLFWMVESAMRKALEAKHPRPRGDVDPERPQRSPRVFKIHNASGFPDVLVDDPTARIPPVQASLPGYEESGEDDAGEDA
jgi:hypothetical protein